MMRNVDSLHNKICGGKVVKKTIAIIVLVIISLIGLYSCIDQEKTNNNQKDLNDRQEEKNNKIGENTKMKIKISNGIYEIIYLLNDSQASKTLYAQLPLDVDVENYGDNEKIFYPPKSLDVNQTPLLESGGEGTLGYFAPWDDVVMYYGSCGSYNGLYVLGEAISGSEYIRDLSGNLHIEKEGN